MVAHHSDQADMKPLFLRLLLFLLMESFAEQRERLCKMNAVCCLSVRPG